MTANLPQRTKSVITPLDGPVHQLATSKPYAKLPLAMEYLMSTDYLNTVNLSFF